MRVYVCINCKKVLVKVFQLRTQMFECGIEQTGYVHKKEFPADYIHICPTCEKIITESFDLKQETFDSIYTRLKEENITIEDLMEELL